MIIDPISWSHAWPFLLSVFAGGYLLGSVPFGLILPMLFGFGDVRSIGSGSIGATNVLRLGSKPLAFFVLLLDSGKGAIAVALGWSLFGNEAGLIAGLAAALGHCFPVWLRFKGGKGVATALGTLVAGSFVVGLLACLSWLAIAKLFRISSVAGMGSAILAPVYALILSQRSILDGTLASPQQAEFAALIALLVVFRHHANIRRLLSGTEPRIGEKKQDG